uniref:fibroblast growth factor-binding protein 1-like n=1 Tax=Scatophagus argus TaxID=75038 RepID=UPI001ED823CB|nr:fibroblast growth factor-binding protein 1-like [Scatophagus argus]XP_046270884.1 fibroblast growth factor-binding protein 1-like [Scatophagus argus]
MYESHVRDHREPQDAALRTESHKTQLYAQRATRRSFTHLSVFDYLLKEDMMLLRTFALWLLLALLGQQVSQSYSESSKNRRANKTVTPAPGRAQRNGKPAAKGRGKFSINRPLSDAKMQCTWAAKDVADSVRLSVKCENPEARIKGGTTNLWCEYNAKPQRCPGYLSDPKGFWKQVARAFKRMQDKVCVDERALVRAGMCKRAPRDAHFKLDVLSSVASAQSGEPEIPKPRPPRPTSTAAGSPRPTTCTGRPNIREKAEEQCGSSWASLCTFVFSMLQSDDC